MGAAPEMPIAIHLNGESHREVEAGLDGDVAPFEQKAPAMARKLWVVGVLVAASPNVFLGERSSAKVQATIGPHRVEGCSRRAFPVLLLRPGNIHHGARAPFLRP